ncbi:MAG: DUF3226 domain-containing protein [Candidatus Poribacteria bacterium]
MYKSLGIVRDAENNPKSAFQSVCSALDHSKISKPKKPCSLSDGSPRVSVLILPDANTEGMLETICLRAVANDLVIEYIDKYFDCINKKGFCPRLNEKT